jgi:hypothetical protein
MGRKKCQGSGNKWHTSKTTPDRIQSRLVEILGIKTVGIVSYYHTIFIFYIYMSGVSEVSGVNPVSCQELQINNK